MRRPVHCLKVLIGIAVVVSVCVGIAPAQANPARLAEPRSGRGQPIAVLLDGGPPSSASSRIELRREGMAVNAQGVSYTFSGNTGRATGLVPMDLPLGDYEVVVYLDNRAFTATPKLSVSPVGNGDLTLNDFTPANTYDAEEAYLPDSSRWEAQSVEVTQLDLENPGLTGERTLILLNGVPAEVTWDCGDSKQALGSSDNPVLSPQRVCGHLVDDKHIELYRVPKDAKVTVSGLDVTPRIVSTQQMWIRRPLHGVATHVLRLALRGSGFQYLRPSDNIIRINGVRVPMEWDGCASSSMLGSENAPVEAKIHGEVVSPEEIRLCEVPVPDDGQLLISVGYGDVVSKTRPFRVFSLSKLQVASMAAAIALLLALLPLILLSFVSQNYRVAGEPYKFRLLFLDPETDTYSLSKLQFYLWTVVSLFSYAYLFIGRVRVQNLSWPDVPATLPGIISVAAGTAIGAQVITAARGSKGAGEEKPSFADFITSGGVVAPDRLQMLLWTLFGVCAFLVAVLQLGPGTISDLPAVPERLLYLMGISSAGYLGGKLARKAGPVVTDISIDPPDSDDAITKQQTLATQILPDLVHPIVTAQSQLSALSSVSNVHAKAAADALAAAIKAAGSAHTTSEINLLIATLGTLRAQAEQEAVAAAADFGKVPAMATQADAEIAQRAAAILQDFSADVTQALSEAAAAAMTSVTSPSLVPRVIELRGTGLAADGLFEIDHTDLPFRMLLDKDGRDMPEILARDETNPNLARILRLTIDPAKLASSYLEQYHKWFGSDGKHLFTLTNPDGQKADISFTLGPAAQKDQAS